MAIPEYPGAKRFKGMQLHTKDYWTADEFVGQHVIIVGGGISAVQTLDDISRVTSTARVNPSRAAVPEHAICVGGRPGHRRLGRGSRSQGPSRPARSSR